MHIIVLGENGKENTYDLNEIQKRGWNHTVVRQNDT